MKYRITFTDGSHKIVETEQECGQFFNKYRNEQPFDEIDGIVINFENVLYIEKNINSYKAEYHFLDIDELITFLERLKYDRTKIIKEFHYNNTTMDYWADGSVRYIPNFTVITEQIYEDNK